MGMYQYLLYCYGHLIEGEPKDFIILIDNSKKKTFQVVNENVWYLKFTDEYASVFQREEILESNKLEFALAKKEYSHHFFQYIMNFLTTDKKFFQKEINGILIKDYRGEILSVKNLILGNVIIDKKLIGIIKKFFKNLGRITFNDCIIENDSNLSELDCPISLVGCEIKNINSFGFCQQEIRLSKCKIDDISHTVINSNKISIIGESCEDEMLTTLFFKCHFPELEELEVGIDIKNEDGTYYNKCLNFIAKSCPVLINLKIDGKIISYDFLYHFNKLSSCEISSVDDTIGVYPIFNPYIVDDKKREEIISKTRRKIETALDINLAMYDKLKEILNGLNTINFTDQEKKIYLNEYLPSIFLNPLRYLKDGNINYYYIYNSKNKTLELHADHSGEVFVINDRLYIYKELLETSFIKQKQQFVPSVPFIYHPNGLPIIFKSKGPSREVYINKALSMEEWYNHDEYFDAIIEDQKERKLMDNNIK